MTEQDAEYFKSYDDIVVHKTMLSDSARMLAYKEMIEHNRDLFVDKIVIDVGCGTGILSLFAARCGAKHVYAIEAAEHISNLCREIIDCNNYTDRVTVLSGRVEDVQLPNGILADTLISEWMGFYLLHESMLDSVIAARDRLLQPGGAICPSAATIYACPVSLKQFYRDNFDCWRNFYGFDFSPVCNAVRQSSQLHPEIMLVPKDTLLSDPQPVLSLDLQYVGTEDLRSIMASLDFVVKRNDVMHGFALWFDVAFDAGVEQSTLNTGPLCAPTHWKQTVVLLPSALLVNKDSEVACRIMLQQDTDNTRRYNITVEVPDDSEDESEEDSDNAEDNVDVTGQMDAAQTSLHDLQQLITEAMDKVV